MTNRRKAIDELRSQRWFSGPGAVGAHKHRQIKHAGFSTADFKDKPVIAILSTWSDFQTCHSHFPERIEDVKRGIWQAGGFPAVIPVQSVSESFLRPTSMLFAIARRLGCELSLGTFAQASEAVPVVCNLMPAGK